MKGWLLVICMVMVLAGCGTGTFEKKNGTIPNSIGNPTVQEVLKGNPEANMIMYNDVVLVSGIDWVDEVELTKGEFLLEITLKTDDAEQFENGAANQLPIGTKIYGAKERGDIVIAETDAGDIRYFKLVEG
ncbi:hypothetical protein [Paenibacillus paeoniae]|uniref:Uncharacterized protein n=1 Tax=Paenibacillus paeoniae TaxID=2292705 RepID=A0A371PLF6_9BACL|nr:hypothetical protein [Paenibacillus paeoniae]REK77038.1 hypothetical protein DX130_08525 [Paenibacillus paeoniae]